MTKPTFKNITGFTLAELLISLAVLGIIATFTLPKLLTATGDNQAKAALKHTFSTVHGLLYSAYLDGSFTSVDNLLSQKFNYRLFCPHNSTVGECGKAYWAAGWDDRSMDRFISFDNVVVWSDGNIVAMYNLKQNDFASASLNTAQTFQIGFYFNSTNAIISNYTYYTWSFNNIRPGEVMVNDVPTYQYLFK